MKKTLKMTMMMLTMPITTFENDQQLLPVRRVLLWVAQTGGQTCHRRFTILLLLFAKCLQCSQRHVNKRFLCSGRASPFNPKCRRTINATTALVALRIQVWVLQSWYDTQRVVVTCETLLSTHLCLLHPPTPSNSRGKIANIHWYHDIKWKCDQVLSLQGNSPQGHAIYST